MFPPEWNQHSLNDRQYPVVPVELTTSVACLTSARFMDPFAVSMVETISASQAASRHYTYMRTV